jgi:hypothetical protein
MNRRVVEVSRGCLRCCCVEWSGEGGWFQLKKLCSTLVSSVVQWSTVMEAIFNVEGKC